MVISKGIINLMFRSSNWGELCKYYRHVLFNGGLRSGFGIR